MDIHRPKHPIVSVRTFLTEMFTVTCGIIIALGLEALVVAHHNHGLRAEAVREFRAEIAATQTRLHELLATDHDETTLITNLLAMAEARLAHAPASVPEGVTVPRSFALLPNDAWQTALATQAIGQLPFAQVRVLSELHNGAVAFNDFEAQAREQWVGVSAYGDPDHSTDDELRHALQALRIAFAYRHSMTILARSLLAHADAAERALDAGG